MDGWVGHVGWPIADVWPTKWSSVQLAVWRRTGKVRRSKTSVLPLCYAANYPYFLDWAFHPEKWGYCTSQTERYSTPTFQNEKVKNLLSPAVKRSDLPGWTGHAQATRCLLVYVSQSGFNFLCYGLGICVLDADLLMELRNENVTKLRSYAHLYC